MGWKTNLIGFFALAASMYGCSDLKFKTQENGMNCPVYSLDKAKVHNVVVRLDKGDFEATISEVDRNGDKKTDLIIYELKLPECQYLPEWKNVMIFADNNLDGFSDTVYEDILNGHVGFGADGIIDRVTDHEKMYMKNTGKKELGDDMKMENIVKGFLSQAVKD